jgi:hypothetical protein
MFQAGFLDKGIGGRGVVLTDAALSKIQVVSCLQNPMPVCSIQASKITDYDLMELLLALESKGWTWKTLPPKKAREELCHKPQEPLEWYSQSHVINKEYLQCLLRAEDLFNKGVKSIPHWTTNIAPAEAPQFLFLESEIPMDLQHAILAGEPEMAPIVDDSIEVDSVLEALAAADSISELEEDCNASGPDIDPAVEIAVEDNPVHEPQPPEPAGGPDVPASSDESDSDMPALGKPAAWGPFRLTVKQRSATGGRTHGGVEASCPCHRRKFRSQTSDNMDR